MPASQENRSDVSSQGCGDDPRQDCRAANQSHEGQPLKPPLRLCGYCQMWNSRPCGEGCGLSVRDPTWEQHQAAELARKEGQ